MLPPIAPLLRAGCLDSRTALVISCESFLWRWLPPQLVSNIFLLSSMAKGLADASQLLVVCNIVARGWQACKFPGSSLACG